MVEVWRDLWGSSGPTPMLKQGHWEPFAQQCVQMAFEYLQRWRLQNASGQSALVLGTFRGKQCFLIFRGNLLCFKMCPLRLVLSLGTSGKCLAPSSVHSPLRYLHTLTKCPEPALLQPEQSLVSQPFPVWEMLQSQSINHLSGDALDSLQYVHVLLAWGSPALDTALQMLCRGEELSPSTHWQHHF